jgi:hypothetical protein
MRCLVLLWLIILAGCKAEEVKTSLKETAPVTIYQTSSDYSGLVPVQLSPDGQRIVSFPDPRDLKVGDRWLKPVKLKNGFWLDQQGVGRNTAFLQLNYEEYAALPAVPDSATLLELILVRKPFMSMYACGRKSDFGNLVVELNQAVVKNRLDRFKKIL